MDLFGLSEMSGSLVPISLTTIDTLSSGTLARVKTSVTVAGNVVGSTVGSAVGAGVGCVTGTCALTHGADRLNARHKKTR